jgi:site-specific recombinase XerD
MLTGYPKSSLARAGETELEGEMARLARYLKAERKSPRTIKSYTEAVMLLARFLLEKGMPTQLTALTREHLTEFMQDQQDRHRPATALNRYRSLNVFFNWLVEEGEITMSPMMRMKPPKVEADPPDVISPDHMRKLFKACEGAGFRERRDMAMLRLMLDTGLRREEVAGIHTGDVDLDEQLVRVVVKGNRVRRVHYNGKAARDLDRYLRARDRYIKDHRDAETDWLWIGSTGRGHITGSGIYQILEYRANLAGLGRIKPHQFRHSFAHYYRAAGGSEDDLMTKGGWRSREMVRRYGSSMAEERAIQVDGKYSPGDQF